jgi:hypothetical protein
VTKSPYTTIGFLGRWSTRNASRHRLCRSPPTFDALLRAGNGVIAVAAVKGISSEMLQKTAAKYSISATTTGEFAPHEPSGATRCTPTIQPMSGLTRRACCSSKSQSLLRVGLLRSQSHPQSRLRHTHLHRPRYLAARTRSLADHLYLKRTRPTSAPPRNSLRPHPPGRPESRNAEYVVEPY